MHDNHRQRCLFQTLLRFHGILNEYRMFAAVRSFSRKGGAQCVCAGFWTRSCSGVSWPPPHTKRPAVMMHACCSSWRRTGVAWGRSTDWPTRAPQTWTRRWRQSLATRPDRLQVHGANGCRATGKPTVHIPVMPTGHAVAQRRRDPQEEGAVHGLQIGSPVSTTAGWTYPYASACM